MYRIGYLAMFVGLAVVAQDSYDVCKKCNRSFPYAALQDTASYNYLLRSNPTLLLQETSHLSDEDQTEDNQLENQRSFNRQNRNLFPEYRSLCELVMKKIYLDDIEYEYQPPHYHEVYCKNHATLNNLQNFSKFSHQKCVHPGFHCVQRSKTVFFVRRRWDSECWEPYTKEIASSCDCMWPVSILGDITDHY